MTTGMTEKTALVKSFTWNGAAETFQHPRFGGAECSGSDERSEARTFVVFKVCCFWMLLDVNGVSWRFRVIHELHIAPGLSPSGLSH